MTRQAERRAWRARDETRRASPRMKDATREGQAHAATRLAFCICRIDTSPMPDLEPRGAERSEEVRSALNQAIPAGYNPWLHLACTVGSGLVVLAVAIAKTPMPTLRDLVAVPVTLLLANGFEWRVHKSILHRRFVPPFASLYDRHTPEHHMVFHYDTMPIRSAREMKLVLIPAWGVLGIAISALPYAALVGHFTTPAAGWLTLATSGMYAVAYEVSHLSYHLPEDGPVGRLSLVRVLREHHRRHHDPRFMQKWNFNVTVPFFDLVHGTIAKDAWFSAEARAARGREARSDAARSGA